ALDLHCRGCYTLVARAVYRGATARVAGLPVSACRWGRAVEERSRCASYPPRRPRRANRASVDQLLSRVDDAVSAAQLVAHTAHWQRLQQVAGGDRHDWVQSGRVRGRGAHRCPPADTSTACRPVDHFCGAAAAAAVSGDRTQAGVDRRAPGVCTRRRGPGRAVDALFLRAVVLSDTYTRCRGRLRRGRGSLWIDGRATIRRPVGTRRKLADGRDRRSPASCIDWQHLCGGPCLAAAATM